MQDLIDGVRITGEIVFHDRNVFAPDVDVFALRRRIGMVFQKSNPFPKSIYENVAYGCRIHGIRGRVELDEIVERSLTAAALWDEVHDRLNDSALGLSGGQQQRLCIARAMQSRCCWPPDKPSALSERRSFTSSKRPARTRLRSTISSSSTRPRMPWMRQP